MKEKNLKEEERQVITDRYALYQGDAIEYLPQFPAKSIDMSIYSPPFYDVFTYTGYDNDMANCKDYDEFLEHYEYLVREISRVTRPGRMTCVQCMDIPRPGIGGLIDMPGDFIRIHEKNDFKYWDRHCIWNEPLTIALKTRSRTLMHQTLCIDDGTKTRGALADYLLVFKKAGENKEPVLKPYGLTEYIGDLELLNEEEKKEYIYLKEKYKDHKDDKTNKFSQWLFRRIASSFWTDIRKNRVLPYRPARDKDEERHVCPMPIDVSDRAVILWTNPGDKVLTPCAGVGTEVHSAVNNKRYGIGIELKPSYFRQMVKNMKTEKEIDDEQPKLINL